MLKIQRTAKSETSFLKKLVSLNNIVCYKYACNIENFRYGGKNYTLQIYYADFRFGYFKPSQ